MIFCMFETTEQHGGAHLQSAVGPSLGYYVKQAFEALPSLGVGKAAGYSQQFCADQLYAFRAWSLRKI
jgi:hypothetical protein